MPKNVSEFRRHQGKAEWNHFDPSLRLKNTFHQSQYRVVRALSQGARRACGVGCVRTSSSREAGNKPSRQTSLVCPGTLALLTIKSLAAFGHHRIENSNNRRRNIHSWFPCYALTLCAACAPALLYTYFICNAPAHSERWCQLVQLAHWPDTQRGKKR